MSCGDAALAGAVVGRLAGLRFGLSLAEALAEETATEELVNTADFWANTEPTTATETISSLSKLYIDHHLDQIGDQRWN